MHTAFLRVLRHALPSLFLLPGHQTLAQVSYATTDSSYARLVDEALEHLKKNECQLCSDKYEAAFKVSQRSVLSRLRAASCAFACKNEQKWKQDVDFALQTDWASCEQILADKRGQYPELSAYQGSEFYRYALEKIDAIKKANGYDAELAAELEIIERDDQALRQQLRDDMSQEERRAIWDKIIRADSINLLKIEQIIAKHGYPGRSKVGNSLSSTTFLVIQHAALPVQEKYFSLLEEAANKGELSKSSFALLVDRVRMRKGQKQLYGSQVVRDPATGLRKFHDIEDEPNVNKRRADMGLGPLEEYAKRFGIEYQVPKN
jgi:hypothetical protein